MNLIWPKIFEIMNYLDVLLLRYDKKYFLLKMLFFLGCFNIGLICPLASRLFSKSLAFNTEKLETEDDDFPSLFDLRNVSWCKIKLILIIMIMLYDYWKCTNCLFCNVCKEIRCFLSISSCCCRLIPWIYKMWWLIRNWRQHTVCFILLCAPDLFIKHF